MFYAHVFVCPQHQIKIEYTVHVFKGKIIVAMTHFTNFPVVVCLAPFLITLGDGLSSTHWIVQDGAYFSPYAYSLSYQEDASCMDVCLRVTNNFSYILEDR